MPDLALLETFYEVARLGSVTSAAQRLGRSQPAISHRLQQLEADLGVPVFEKIGRKLHLTSYGRRLLVACVDLIAMARNVGDVVRSAGAPVAGRVVVGTFPTISANLCVPAMATLLDSQPDLEVVLVLSLFDDLLERLRTGAVDVVLVFAPGAPSEFDCERVGETSLVVVAHPSRFPASKSGKVTPAELRNHRLVPWRGPADPLSDRIQEYARKHQLINDVTPSIPHVETLRELVAADAGYSILPLYTVQRDVAAGRVRVLSPVGLKVPSHLYLITRQRQVITPPIEEVRRQLAAIEVM